jgi:DNA-binding HxlR family transcriptional regulator
VARCSISSIIATGKSSNQILLLPPNRPEAGRFPGGTCRSGQILDSIGGKWIVVIPLLLRREALRFNELRHGIEGIVMPAKKVSSIPEQWCLN